MEAVRASLPGARRRGDNGTATIAGLTLDSREAAPGTVFFAMPGAKVDASVFAADAFAAGAVAVVTQRDMEPPPGREVLVVDDVRQSAADAAVALCRDLLGRMTLVGVTGTNGKTTTTWLVRSVVAAAGHPAAAVGTTGVVGPDGTVRPLKNTTPDVFELVEILRRLDEEGCRHVALEVSSQGVVQRRVAGLPFRVGVFTNLTPEHMETHGSFEAYREAKVRFFREAGPAAEAFGRPFTAVVGGDDPSASFVAAACPETPLSFGLGEGCDVRADELRVAGEGSQFFLAGPAGKTHVRFGMPGRINVLNALAAAAVGLALGFSGDVIAAGLVHPPVVPGRLQRVPGRSRRVYVDYAHTSDALEKLLVSAREMVPHDGRLVVVFGCGGDRDATKRPRMGAVAARLADSVVVTSDNPRSEEPRAIVDQILAGVAPEAVHRVIVEVDRRRAIEGAVRAAEPADLILLAGKGHEDYQLVAGTTHPFDDVAEAARVVKELDGDAAH